MIFPEHYVSDYEQAKDEMEVKVRCMCVCVCVCSGEAMGEGDVSEARQSHVWYKPRRGRAQSKGLVKPPHRA